MRFTDGKKQVEAEGTKREKLQIVFNETLRLCKENERKIIHDRDLKIWALGAARRVSFDTFKASKWWIHKFKKINNIGSRKITKFVTKRYADDYDVLVANATVFVGDIQQIIEERGEDSIFNTDQSGFNLEFHGGRTLTEKGLKTVLAEAQSLNSLTHSYTIQPFISVEGQLMPVLLIVLQESGGSFGPRVSKSLFTAPNIYVVASSSGKLTKDIFQAWVKHVYYPNVPDKSTLILDSWTGQSESNVQSVQVEGKEIVIKTIPKGTTGLVQPLDVFGFRIWKNFVRTFYDYVILHDVDFKIHERNNILRIQAFVHNQMSSPRFKNMWRYSWYKSGYTLVEPGPFPNPVSYCFHCEGCTCSECDDVPVMTCAWCKSCLCLQHLIVNIHLCNKYSE